MQTTADETRTHLGLAADAAVAFEAIVEGGSSRTFHRATADGGRSCIVMEYGAEKEENLYYVEIAEFLLKLGVRVPRVLFHNPARRVAWM
ncbi:MAG TPA: hypothetical protein VEY30_05665, partial [Myxococcaceae bacterium]|nr:hypothetical protein [Myxococcaceae bacterium]